MEPVHVFGYAAAMRLPLALVLLLCLAACHRDPVCPAPDGGTTLAEPCVKNGQALPDGADCCLGTTPGTCQSHRCVAAQPAPDGGSHDAAEMPMRFGWGPFSPVGTFGGDRMPGGL